MQIILDICGEWRTCAACLTRCRIGSLRASCNHTKLKSCQFFSVLISNSIPCRERLPFSNVTALFVSSRRYPYAYFLVQRTYSYALCISVTREKNFSVPHFWGRRWCEWVKKLSNERADVSWGRQRTREVHVEPTKKSTISNQHKEDVTGVSPFWVVLQCVLVPLRCRQRSTTSWPCHSRYESSIQHMYGQRSCAHG